MPLSWLTHGKMKSVTISVTDEEKPKFVALFTKKLIEHGIKEFYIEASNQNEMTISSFMYDPAAIEKVVQETILV